MQLPPTPLQPAETLMQAPSLVRIVKILNVEPHPNADRLEVATVEGWKVITQKGVHATGGHAVYFELDSLIPHREWSAFLFKMPFPAEEIDQQVAPTKPTTQLPGSQLKERYHRLRTVRLRGILSQGLLVPVTDISEYIGTRGNTHSVSSGTPVFSLQELLGVKKYEKQIPADLLGYAKGDFPNFLSRTNEPRLQSYPALLDEIRDIPITVALKYDGTSFTAYKRNSVFGVCSANLELLPSEDNAYWEIANATAMPEWLPEGFAIQGELCGPKIQGNKLILTKSHLYVFDIFDISKQL